MKQRQIIQKSTNKNVLPKIPRDIRKWLHQQATKVYSICYAAKITGTGKTDQEFRIVCHKGIQQKSQLGFAYMSTQFRENIHSVNVLVNTNSQADIRVSSSFQGIHNFWIFQCSWLILFTIQYLSSPFFSLKVLLILLKSPNYRHRGEEIERHFIPWFNSPNDLNSQNQ